MGQAGLAIGIRVAVLRSDEQGLVVVVFHELVFLKRTSGLYMRGLPSRCWISYHTSILVHGLWKDQKLLVRRTGASNGALVSQPDGEDESFRGSSKSGQQDSCLRETHAVLL